MCDAETFRYISADFTVWPNLVALLSEAFSARTPLAYCFEEQPDYYSAPVGIINPTSTMGLDALKRHRETIRSAAQDMILERVGLKHGFQLGIKLFHQGDATSMLSVGLPLSAPPQSTFSDFGDSEYDPRNVSIN